MSYLIFDLWPWLFFLEGRCGLSLVSCNICIEVSCKDGECLKLCRNHDVIVFALVVGCDTGEAATKGYTRITTENEYNYCCQGRSRSSCIHLSLKQIYS